VEQELIPGVPVTVRLRERHIRFRDKIAHKRQALAIDRGLKDRDGSVYDPLASNVLGVGGELAAYLFYWPVKWKAYTSGSIKNLPDLTYFIDVKTASSDRDLIVNKKCIHDHWAYLLVDASKNPTYRLCGWLWGWNVKLYWNDRRQLYVVPQAKLRHPTELMVHLRRREPLACREQVFAEVRRRDEVLRRGLWTPALVAA
jgi:hypothetical protein